MKKLKLIFLVLFIGLTSLAFSQAPGKFNYQAVIRDGFGNGLANQPVTLVFKLFNNAAGAGAVLYQESFNATTNSFGVVNLQVGTSPSFGNLTNLNWDASPYYVDILINNSSIYNGGNLAQLVSVPYALYAAKADTAAYATSTVNDYAVYQYMHPSNASGIANVTGWNSRQLNTTQSSSGSSISRNGNLITLESGTYYISANAYAYNTGDNALVIFNNATPLLYGGLGFSSPTTSNATPFAEVSGIITITSTTVIELKHWFKEVGSITNQNVAYPYSNPTVQIYISKIK